MPAGPAPDAAIPAATKTPIFIVGMHRSGTTLLEQLLDASPQVRGVGELYDFTSALRFAADHHCRGVVDTTIVGRANDIDFPGLGRPYLPGPAWRLGAEPFFVATLPTDLPTSGLYSLA